MNRRFFIKTVSLISGGLVFSSKPGNLFAAASVQKISGTVTAGNKKLKRVTVSDGFSVAFTNSDGRYELPYNKEAQFVFVSVPPGYEFPREKSIARFYHTITDNKKPYDFHLVPLKKDDTRHQFIIWADPQVKDNNDVGQMLSTSVPDVQQFVQSLGAGALIHGISVGDLVWDNHSLFRQYNEAVEKMNIPFFQALGNHDMDYNKGGDESSDDTFQSLYGPTYYSFNRGRAHYIVLDDVRYLGTERNYDGYITQQQLDWLKLDLEHVGKDSLIIICLHIPVHNAVKNNEDLYALLASFKNVHIMSGHTHYNINTIKNEIFEHNHGTVCGAWWTGPVCGDGTPRGYGVYEVDGNDLKWHYKSTGHDRDYQLSVNIEDLNGQTRVIANVWNWDPEWKVEWWADDKYMGAPEQVKGFDPLSLILYKGDKLPADRRAWIEPHKTNHLFLVHASTEVKTIKVVATDRFGKKYESEVTR